MSDAPATALLEWLSQEDGLSSARVCKRLGLSRSELQRLLAELGPDPGVGGLDLVQVRSEDGRETLWLSARARRAQAAP